MTDLNATTNAMTNTKPPRTVAWAIGGSDSCAGAGIQADLKAMQEVGIHCCTVITAVTAQNTAKVSKVEEVNSSLLQAQLDALAEDIAPSAVKLGLLPSRTVVETVAENLVNLQRKQAFPIVCDPVMVATSNDALIQPDAVEALQTKILPIADLVTPNLPEATALAKNRSGIISTSLQQGVPIEQLAETILQTGVRAVLIKGGHSTGDVCQDLLFDGKTKWWLSSPRQDTGNVHGTGCTLSATIAACLAQGKSLLESTVIAKARLNQALRSASIIGSGSRVLCQPQESISIEDLPILTHTANMPAERQEHHFERHEDIGLYPIVSSTANLQKIANTGVRTAQIRVKNLAGNELRQELKAAVELSVEHNIRLYVNDFWQLAIELGAWGVHLGQEDLETADIGAISHAGLRLGISTHCHWEVARALTISPSYIAIGPIFPTTTKEMVHSPQGLEGFLYWRKMLDYPLVAIGGIFLPEATQLLEAGANGIAVVRAIEAAAVPEKEALKWLQLFPNRSEHSASGIHACGTKTGTKASVSYAR